MHLMSDYCLNCNSVTTERKYCYNLGSRLGLYPDQEIKTVTTMKGLMDKE